LRKPKTARIEALWLEAVTRFFWTVDDLCRFSGKSKRRIQAGLKRAKDEPIEIKTVWAIEWVSNANSFVPEHQCTWHGGAQGKIPEDFPVGCLYCMKAGLTAMIARHWQPIQIEAKAAKPESKLAGTEGQVIYETKR
jgi:hypothetical protein